MFHQNPFPVLRKATNSSWDPFDHTDEQPSRLCLKRVKKDLVDLAEHPVPRVFVWPADHDITSIDVMMLGEPDSPYEGGAFHFYMKCPPDYPLSPPRVRFLNTDEGRVRFHVHLCATGKVCVGTLGTLSGPGWQPTQTLRLTLASIQELFGAQPLQAFKGKATPHEAALYDAFVQHETIRVAVCDQVDAALRADARCPPIFRSVILDSFLKLYTKFENTCVTRRHQTGWQLWDPVGFKYTTAQYKTLLTRLQALRDKVDEKAKEAPIP
ncbi:hypothetical protein MTO96_035694 [Rhipicephalus appendiculatus]